MISASPPTCGKYSVLIKKILVMCPFDTKTKLHILASCLKNLQSKREHNIAQQC